MNTSHNQSVPLLHDDIQTLRSNKDTSVETELHVIILILLFGIAQAHNQDNDEHVKV